MMYPGGEADNTCPSREPAPDTARPADEHRAAPYDRRRGDPAGGAGSAGPGRGPAGAAARRGRTPGTGPPGTGPPGTGPPGTGAASGVRPPFGVAAPGDGDGTGDAGRRGPRGGAARRPHGRTEPPGPQGALLAAVPPDSVTGIARPTLTAAFTAIVTAA
ncbi:hypothetical protein GCM10010129_02790 [Streptomyces fumigatiscleroticus]|nr:hypothetical protein GCM10010129_02790 [Streptomyces fumigatiscleroticus]